MKKRAFAIVTACLGTAGLSLELAGMEQLSNQITTMEHMQYESQSESPKNRNYGMYFYSVPMKRQLDIK